MNIVSYRGPGKAGGVSAALARAWECHSGSDSQWWYLSDNTVEVSTASGAEQFKSVADLPADVVEGHYRYCNNLIWPVMHDMDAYAIYSPDEQSYYNTFNEAVGWCLLRGAQRTTPGAYFVQDYQLALLPRRLRNAGMKSVVFWHIPWPRAVSEQFLPAIADLARGLLNAEAIGFHTQEYADNFLRFVQEHLNECAVIPESRTVWTAANVKPTATSLLVEPGRYAGTRTTPRQTRRSTKLVVAPLGIDFRHWESLAERQQNTLWHPSMMPSQFVLSVDRADYTKGVTDRLQAIDLFFDKYPQWQGQITFAQICGRTRAGLPAFEQYWQDCRDAYAQLQSHHARPGWQPLIWLEKSFSPAELAHAYRTTRAMLITAVRDGMNLTAKEFIACQGPRAGVLAISSGIGAVHELGCHSVTFQPENIEAIADGIHQALTMERHESSWHAAVLKESLRHNTLNKWWSTFSNLLGPARGRTISADKHVLPPAKLGT